MTNGQIVEATLTQIREDASKGLLDAAEAKCQRLLETAPQEPEAWSWLGLLYTARRKFEDAETAFQRASRLAPDNSHYYSYLSAAIREQGRASEAEQYARKSIELNSTHASYWIALGAALADQQQWSGAATAYRKALEIDPANAAAWQALATAEQDCNRLDEAQAAFERSLQIAPGGEATIGYAYLLSRRDETERAANLLLAYLQRAPHSALAAVALFHVLQKGGELSRAEGACRMALQINQAYEDQRLPPPLLPHVHSNLLVRLPFLPGYDSAAIHQELCRWDRQHSKPLQRCIQPHTNQRSPSRRLRVGYVSPNFNNHCQVFFMMPLLAAHDHSRLEVFCYSDVASADVLTDHLRLHADVWRETRGMPNERLAELIRQDGIDILVDLTMHMEGNRLLVFARKPAPVQVCWLAYPGTTGLTTMDYRLTDPFLDPPGHFDDCYSESSIRLLETFWCYDPLVLETDVTPLPALQSGHITFGNFNGIDKLNESVVKLWSGVLKAVNGSRMTLLMHKGKVRQRILDWFAECGVESQRITLVETQPRLPYMKEYQKIDLVLDTVPYNGHTTSLDAYWMGVPVITLVGQTVVGRAGLSMLQNLGLTDLIANTPEEFLSIAVEQSRDLVRLKELRGSLRQRMQCSPLMNFQRFSRNMESAYRWMWEQWCERNRQQPQVVPS